MSVSLLADAPWRTAPTSLAVIAALEAAGGPGCARFVGGCVRNALIGQPVDDIDIATPLTPDQVIAALKAAGLKSVPTGIAHGTVTAVAYGTPFEITTLRRDVETDGRRAVVAFTDDWSQDAQRRDFRLNALYADPAGAIYDPTGAGVEDALAGRIVFVGEPATRIAEDGLRILRFFRFLAWFGRGAPDAAALAACADMKDHIAQLSAERIAKELLKLLAAQDPRAAVRLMADIGVLGEVAAEVDRSSPRRINQAADLSRFERLVGIESEEHIPPDPLLRLAALLPDDPAAAAATAGRLRLSNAQRDRLVAALTADGPISGDMTPPEARRAIYRLGGDTFCDRVMLAWAQATPITGSAPWAALITLARTWPRPSFPLTGEDVMAEGRAKGPAIGEVLRGLEAEWVDGDFSADRARLIDRLKRVVRLS